MAANPQSLAKAAIVGGATLCGASDLFPSPIQSKRLGVASPHQGNRFSFSPHSLFVLASLMFEAANASFNSPTILVAEGRAGSKLDWPLQSRFVSLVNGSDAHLHQIGLIGVNLATRPLRVRLLAARPGQTHDRVLAQMAEQPEQDVVAIRAPRDGPHRHPVQGMPLRNLDGILVLEAFAIRRVNRLPGSEQLE